MSEIQVGQINSTDGSTAITTGADGYVSFAKTQIGGRRNLIINGAMQVAQRGTSATGKTSSGYYTCDRFRSSTNAEQTETHEQSTDAPDGFSDSYKVTVTTADASIDASDYAAITQIIEAQNLQHLQYGTSSAKQVTLSFWVKASATGTYTVAFYHYDAASNNYISQSYTISSADTWEHKTITLDGNTADAIGNNNGAGLEVYFLYSAGSDYTSGTSNTWGTSTNFAVGHTSNLVGTLNATFQITGVQLEVGTVATPFENRSYGEELALCQRYYIRYGDNDTGNANDGGVFNTLNWNRDNHFIAHIFPTPMRATPAIGYNSLATLLLLEAGSTATPTSLSSNGGNATRLEFNVGTAAFGTAGNASWLRILVNGYIDLDAEL